MRWTVLHGRGRGWIAAATLALSLTAVAAGLAEQDERAAAMAAVNELEGNANSQAIAADSIAHAKEALDRATRMQAAGDSAHARLAAGLARQWAETGRDLVRAAETEAKATDLRRKAQDSQAQIAKTRALVEEVIARTGRLRAEIEAIERDGGSRRTAVELHDGDGTSPASPGRGRNLDAGAPKRQLAGASKAAAGNLASDGGLP